MLEIINMTINKESTRSKGYSQSQFQRCFAVKSNLNPVLDLSRTVYSNLLEEFHGMCFKINQNFGIIALVLIINMKCTILDRVKILGEQLETEHLFMKNSSNRGFHVQVDLKNIKNFDVKRPPSICKYVS